MLLRPPGVGKTHLAIALTVKAAEAGHWIMFLSLEKLMSQLKKAQQENRLERQIQLLVLTEVEPLRLRLCGCGCFYPNRDGRLTQH